MDELDQNILRILKKDASTSLTKIGEVLGVPSPTVYLRVRKLRERGAIKQFTIVLGSEELKPVKYAFVKVKNYLLSDMSKRVMRETGEKLSEHPDVKFASKVSDDEIFVIWEGGEFDPSSFSDVVEVRSISERPFKYL